MTEHLPDLPLPRRLLLANDLSHRCDRALDRATQLARQWQVPLRNLTVLEPQALIAAQDREGGWRDAGQADAEVERRLRLDIGEVDIQLEVQVEEGDPTEAILAAATRDDLIITGIASHRGLSRILLGNTTDRVVRRSPGPVLVVRQRARVPYQRVIVASDFSESSRLALQVAATAFPDASLILFHAYYPPFAGRRDSDQARLEMARAAQAELEAFLDASGLSEADRRRIELHQEFGSIEALLGDYARHNAIDLIVLGSHGSTAAFDTLIGTTARRVLESAAIDVLVVRDPRARS